MHIYTLHKWQHDHDFTSINPSNERKTLSVVILTAAMMVLEIAAGGLFGSMALLADGWHMGTHAAALGITLFAYRYARRHANNPTYTFGTGKISVLGGFTSAVVLQVIAILMGIESAGRLFTPRPIRFDEAIAVAVLGLIVNLVSVRLLGAGFSLAALFMLVMIFAQVFTTVYDYIPVVGPLFRDRFWLVFLALGVVLVLRPEYGHMA